MRELFLKQESRKQLNLQNKMTFFSAQFAREKLDKTVTTLVRDRKPLNIFATRPATSDEITSFAAGQPITLPATTIMTT